MSRNKQIHISIIKTIKLRTNVEDICNKLTKKHSKKITVSDFFIYGVLLAMREYSKGNLSDSTVIEDAIKNYNKKMSRS